MRYDNGEERAATRRRTNADQATHQAATLPIAHATEDQDELPKKHPRVPQGPTVWRISIPRCGTSQYQKDDGNQPSALRAQESSPRRSLASDTAALMGGCATRRALQAQEAR